MGLTPMAESNNPIFCLLFKPLKLEPPPHKVKELSAAGEVKPQPPIMVQGCSEYKTYQKVHCLSPVERKKKKKKETPLSLEFHDLQILEGDLKEEAQLDSDSELLCDYLALPCEAGG